MFNAALLRKSFHEAKWLMAACSIALLSMSWIFVWLVSQLDTSKFKQLIDLLPGSLKQFTSVDLDWMVTYAGRVSMIFDEPIVVLCLAVFCISRGSDCVSGELGRGTLEFLLAQPVSRLQVLLSNWLVTLIGIVVITLAAWLGLYLGIMTNSVNEEIPLTITIPIVQWELPVPFGPTEQQSVPMSDRISAAVFFPAIVNFFCFGIFVAGITTLLSAIDRYRWRTIGIITGFYVVSGILKMVGMASESLEWVLWLSFFTVYEPEVFVSMQMQTPSVAWHFLLYDAEGNFQSLGPLANDLILVLLGLAGYIGAAIAFCRRDVPAPL